MDINIECLKCGRKIMMGPRKGIEPVVSENIITISDKPTDPSKHYKCPYCGHEFNSS